MGFKNSKISKLWRSLNHSVERLKKIVKNKINYDFWLSNLQQIYLKSIFTNYYLFFSVIPLIIFAIYLIYHQNEKREIWYFFYSKRFMILFFSIKSQASCEVNQLSEQKGFVLAKNVHHLVEEFCKILTQNR